MDTIPVCGQNFTPEIIARINEVVANEPELTRNQLARRVCEWLNWRNVLGVLKTLSCRVALSKLEKKGLIRQPRKGFFGGLRGRFKRRELPPPVSWEGSVEELKGLRVEIIESGDKERSGVWNELIERYHYLGYTPLAGAQIRYLVVCEAGVIGALSYSASAWRVSSRDEWIGWDEKNRQAHLPEVVCNSRFLLIPSVRAKNLASKVLGLTRRRLGGDWKKRYGYGPVLLETYVEEGRFKGTSYRAAGWTKVGMTVGRGKKDVFHRGALSKKAVYVCPLVADWRERLGGREPERKEPKDWAETELGSVELGDERLQRRLLVLARDFGTQIEVSVPQACGSVAKTKAAYRFFRHPEVTMEKVLRGHREALVERVRGNGVALAVQDTTSLNYNGHKAATDLGDIGSEKGKSKGMLVHDTVVFDESGVPLGVLDAQAWIRPEEEFGKKRQRGSKPIEAKESMKWLRSLGVASELQRRTPKSVVVSVGDREADIYELFEEALRGAASGGAKLLVRASHDRTLKDEQQHLWEKMRATAVAGKMVIEVPRKPGQKKRQAEMAVRYGAVELRSPKNKNQKVSVWAVLIEEEKPPAGVSKLSWMLLTTVAVTTFEEAVRIVCWYLKRWGIELFHQMLKSGCRMEDKQFDTRKKLEACLGLEMVVAWRILHVSRRSRQEPEARSSVHFEEQEWKALVWYLEKKMPTAEDEPNLRNMTRMIARLGGFLGRKCDGEPGWKTLWRGWKRLHDIVACYLQAMNPILAGSPCGQPTYGAG